VTFDEELEEDPCQGEVPGGGEDRELLQPKDRVLVHGHPPLEAGEARVVGAVLVQGVAPDEPVVPGVDVGHHAVGEEAAGVERVGEEEPALGVVEEPRQAGRAGPGAMEAREDEEGAEEAEAGEQDVERLAEIVALWGLWFLGDGVGDKGAARPGRDAAVAGLPAA